MFSLKLTIIINWLFLISNIIIMMMMMMIIIIIKYLKIILIQF